MIRLSAFADEISADPVEQLDVIAENGVLNVEFRSIHGTNVLDLSPEQHTEFRSLLRTRGIGLSAIGSPIGKIPIGDAFEPHLARFEIAMRLAEFYECPRIRVFSFYMPAGEPWEPHRDEVVRRVRTLAGRAEERGISLFLENEKGIYGDTPVRVREVIEAVGSPALRHAFDPANYLEVGADPVEAWQEVGRLVSHFHVKDYDVTTRRNVPAGEGQGRIGYLIGRAVSSGFSGFCVLEPHLIVAEKSFGFTGPARFGDAARALKAALAAEQVLCS